MEKDKDGTLTLCTKKEINERFKNMLRSAQGDDDKKQLKNEHDSLVNKISRKRNCELIKCYVPQCE